MRRVVTRRWKRKSFVIAGKSSPSISFPPVGEDLTARTNFDFLFYLLLSRPITRATAVAKRKIGKRMKNVNDTLIPKP